MFYALIALGLLFIAYLCGRSIKRVGDFYASILLVPPGKIFVGFERWFGAFKKAHETPYSKQPGLVVIVRLVAFAFALTALVAEGYSTLIAVPAMFGDVATSPPPFPGLAVPALAVLIFSLCAIFGIVWLETSENIPPDMQLFEAKPGLRRFAFWSFSASVVTFVLAYAQRSVYLLPSDGVLFGPDGIVTAVLRVAVFLFLAVLIPFSGLVAVWILAVGLQALLGIAFAVVAVIASMLAEIFDFLSMHFSRGRISVYGTTTGIMWPRTYLFDDEDDDTVRPHAVLKGAKEMLEPLVAILYCGEFGVQMQPMMERKLKDRHAGSLVRSEGVVSYTTSEMERLAVAYGTDVSPERVEQKAIKAGARGSRKKALTGLYSRMGEKVIDAHQQVHDDPAALICFIDALDLVASFAMLKDIKRQQPDFTIAVVTMLPALDLKQKADREELKDIAKGLRGLNDLYAEGIVTVAFVFVSHSPFAVGVAAAEHADGYTQHAINGGDVKQMEFVAQDMADLLLQRKQSILNSSTVETLRLFGRFAPFLGFAFASARIALGKENFWQWLLRLFAGRKAANGDKDNIILQAEHCMQLVLEPDSACRAIDEPVLDPKVFVVDIPVAVSDRRFHPIHKQLREDALTMYSAGCFVVSGNGMSLHMAQEPLDPFYVQATCLYPLPANFFEQLIPLLPEQEKRAELPAPVQEDQEEPSPNGAAAPEAVQQEKVVTQ